MNRIKITFVVGLFLCVVGFLGIQYALKTEPSDPEEFFDLHASFECRFAEDVSIQMAPMADGQVEVSVSVSGEMDDTNGLTLDDLSCQDISFFSSNSQPIKMTIGNGELRVFEGHIKFENQNLVVDECDDWEEPECANWASWNVTFVHPNIVRSPDFSSRSFRAQIVLDSDDGVFSRHVTIPDGFVPRAIILDGYQSRLNSTWYEHLLSYDGKKVVLDPEAYKHPIVQHRSIQIRSEFESDRLKSLQQVLLIIASTLIGTGFSACMEAFLSSGVISALRSNADELEPVSQSVDEHKDLYTESIEPVESIRSKNQLENEAHQTDPPLEMPSETLSIKKEEE